MSLQIYGESWSSFHFLRLRVRVSQSVETHFHVSVLMMVLDICMDTNMTMTHPRRHEEFHLCGANLGCVEPFLVQCWLTKELNGDQGASSPTLSISFLCLAGLCLYWCNEESSSSIPLKQKKVLMFWTCSSAVLRECRWRAIHYRIRNRISLCTIWKKCGIP